ncbi:MAG: magnesium transporter, partial [Gammaproteobacteria bacterium]
PYNSYVYLAQQYIQEHHEEFAGLQEIPVIDARQHYKGTISLVDLIAGGRIAPIKSLVREEIAPVYPESSTEEVITLLEDVQWDLLPVIDRDGVFLGAIDRERAVESALKAADKLARSAARLDEDTFASVSKASRERTLWLLTNLMTAVLAALVIGLFQDTLERAVALAVLMPIVTSMGGVAATQTLGITVRGFALRQLHAANIRWLVNRELAVNMFSGLLLAVPSVLIVLYWFEEWLLAGILAVSVISNVVLGAIAGVLIPVIVRRLGIDAAVSGAVIVTTVTDVCGFAIFLSLGSLFYLG